MAHSGSYYAFGFLVQFVGIILVSFHLGIWNNNGPQQQIRKAAAATSYNSTTAVTVEEPPKPLFPKYHSKLQFIFFVGLEGTGHHFLGSLLKKSPDLIRLYEWGILPELAPVRNLLFQHTGSGGPTVNLTTDTALWNAHCMETRADDIPLQTMEDKLVTQLQKIEGLANSSASSAVHVPINTLTEASKYGEVSYPNFAGPCRKLNIPFLDLLYRACDRAQVDCGHVYIYRDPWAFLNSNNIKRRFNRGHIASMHMYKTHLNVIAGELHAYAPQTLGCWGLLDKNATDWESELSQMWGFSDQEWNDHLQKIFKTPGGASKSNPNATKLVIKEEWQPYWKTLTEAHERVIRICEQAKAGNLQADR